jgi:FkbM family methyltransferase
MQPRPSFYRTLPQRLLEELDDIIRHRGALGRHTWLRNLLRRPYHRLINYHNRGLTVRIGGCIAVQLPAEYSGKHVESYESAEFGILKGWCEGQPGGVFVDVGCSIGYYTCAALFSSVTVEVLAIDSDIESLKATERLCAYAPAGQRLSLIQGMITNAPSDLCTLEAAVRATADALARPGVTGDVAATNYRCLDPSGIQPSDLRAFRLDDLTQHLESERPMLIKIDVEGGEWFVLDGAKTTIARYAPTILLSVHPAFLPRYEQSLRDIEAILGAAGYTWKLLAEDHEQHWLCTPSSRPDPGSVRN